MTAVKVTLADGNYWSTRINTTFEGAVEYYLGNSFRSHGGLYSICVTVEEL
ncbi:hypothetical protein [Pseudomonas phage vB_PseuGesM_254]|uniref:Uncharacterized protein n=1 Tax=Pseudomonas phage vB_PseuGesM_254 TaxID=3092638 RepID=A0AAX4G6R2_9CAUD|nr:hypothetical protein [Pseudomonas phage PseuGes_254]